VSLSKPDAPNSAGQRRLFLGLTVLFFLVALLAGLDVIADIREGTTARHLVIEGAVVLVGLLGLLAMARQLLALARDTRALSSTAAELDQQLEQTQAEAARWKAEAGQLLAGLGVAIEQQFERWRLSPAEKEVGLLLLKGLSLKQIAQARGGLAEATIRQQARAIYKKAGLTGRHDLSAFFLEDLLLPLRGD